MQIGGLCKNSFIDYPNRISCVLFTKGCNLSCSYCHNKYLLDRNYKNLISEKDIFSFLSKRNNLLDGIVISGGEPTIQKDIYNFCTKLKNSFNLSIKLDTNGTKPEIIKDLIDNQLIDYVAMDLKTSFDKYFPVFTINQPEVDLLKSIDIIMNSDIDYEFRTTCMRPFIDNEIIKNIGVKIYGAKLWILQKLRTDNMLCTDFFTSYKQINNLEDIKNIASRYVKKCFIR